MPTLQSFVFANPELLRSRGTRQMRMSTSGMAMYKYAVNRAGSWGYRAVS
jgi:hypothetical protein